MANNESEKEHVENGLKKEPENKDVKDNKLSQNEESTTADTDAEAVENGPVDTSTSPPEAESTAETDPPSKACR